MKMKSNTVKRLLTWLSACVMLAALWGCRSVPVSGEAVTQDETDQVAEAVMTIDGQPVTAEEVRIYLYLMQKPYEACYGSSIWQEQRKEGETWEQWLLEEVKRQIIELEILSSRAGQEGMELTDEEKASVDEKAEAAFDSMGDVSERYDITRETVRRVFEKSRLAGLYYETVMDNYDVTLSEDELSRCRAITVQQIFIAEDDETHLMETGQTQEQLAKQLMLRALDGEDFETLSKAYSSENAQWILSLNEEGYVFDTDAWLEENFTEAAWKLEENEISPVIHTSYGYHVLKCTAVDTDELKKQDEENKLKEKKQELFNADYEQWLQALEYTEEAAWQEIHVLEEI